jgi:uncharacterized protein YqeY
MTIREKLKEALMTAMREKNLEAVAALRTALGAIDNAEAVEPVALSGPVVNASADVPRKVLTEDDVLEIVRREATDLRKAAVQYDAIGQVKRAEELRLKLKALDAFI